MSAKPRPAVGDQSTCEKCQTRILDFTRYKRDGVTLCRDCWLAAGDQSRESSPVVGREQTVNLSSPSDPAGATPASPTTPPTPQSAGEAPITDLMRQAFGPVVDELVQLRATIGDLVKERDGARATLTLLTDTELKPPQNLPAALNEMAHNFWKVTDERNQLRAELEGVRARHNDANCLGYWRCSDEERDDAWCNEADPCAVCWMAKQVREIGQLRAELAEQRERFREAAISDLLRVQRERDEARESVAKLTAINDERWRLYAAECSRADSAERDLAVAREALRGMLAFAKRNGLASDVFDECPPDVVRARAALGKGGE